MTLQLITFDAKLFGARFPEFSNVDGDLLKMYFDEAGLLCENAAANPLSSEPARLRQALYLLTAHLAKIYSGACKDNGPSGAVGRISEATEGSVSVRLDFGPALNTEAFYVQTPYGAEYLQVIGAIRAFRYYAQPRLMPGRWT